VNVRLTVPNSAGTGELIAFILRLYGQEIHQWISRGLVLVIFERTTQPLPTSELLASPANLFSMV
jgi:hypothetical protein